jgi:hypothetical protein
VLVEWKEKEETFEQKEENISFNKDKKPGRQG